MSQLNSKNERNILLLGSGMMTSPFIEYLIKDYRNFITVGSFDSKLLNETVKKYAGKNIRGTLIDVVKDTERLEELVSKVDLVASFLPPPLHPYVAKVCLKVGRNMITTSYVSDFMKEISKEVEKKGLVFMNEVGLDPGLDHIITHKVIHEEEKKGNKIIKYESWCGALPAPEICNNPLGYKFSWSPKGALVAMNNRCFQLVNGEVVSFEPSQTIINTVNKKFHECYNIEGYYNRDSRPYIETYNLKDAHTVIRGTLRYKGTTFAITLLKNLGLYNTEIIDRSIKNWNDLFQRLLHSNNNKSFSTYNSEVEIFDSEGGNLSKKELEFLHSLSKYALSKFDMGYIKSNGGYDKLLNQAFSIFQFLEFHSKENTLKGNLSRLDEISILLEKKLKMSENDRDMNFMQNEFDVLTKEGKIINRKLDLIVFGNHNNCGHSATALTVGTPSAICARMILDGQIKERGVLTPTCEKIGEKILSEFEKMKIFVSEIRKTKVKF